MDKKCVGIRVYPLCSNLCGGGGGARGRGTLYQMYHAVKLTNVWSQQEQIVLLFLKNKKGSN